MMTRLVDGVRVAVPPEEEAVILSRWEAEDPGNLTNTKERKNAELELAYKKVIEGGFVSSALGTPHWYASSGDRKAILAAAESSAISVNFSCYEADLNGNPVSGSFALRLHTNLQLQQVIRDAQVIAIDALNTLLTKQAAVAAATTIRDVEIITW